jgi:hypothetical protein
LTKSGNYYEKTPVRSKEITKGFDEIRQLLRENALEAKQRAQEAEQR